MGGSWLEALRITMLHEEGSQFEEIAAAQYPVLVFRGGGKMVWQSLLITFCWAEVTLYSRAQGRKCECSPMLFIAQLAR